MIRTIGESSRYFKDKNIPENMSMKIYGDWINNSLYNSYADEVIFIMNGNELAGLITCFSSSLENSLVSPIEIPTPGRFLSV